MRGWHKVVNNFAIPAGFPAFVLLKGQVIG
jgi:hypothetical protein